MEEESYLLRHMASFVRLFQSENNPMKLGGMDLVVKPVSSHSFQAVFTLANMREEITFSTKERVTTQMDRCCDLLPWKFMTQLIKNFGNPSAAAPEECAECKLLAGVILVVAEELGVPFDPDNCNVHMLRQELCLAIATLKADALLGKAVVDMAKSRDINGSLPG